jgi:hypothetical protein
MEEKERANPRFRRRRTPVRTNFIVVAVLSILLHLTSTVNTGT